MCHPGGVGRARTAGATRLALTAPPCRARHRSTMTKTPRVWGRRSVNRHCAQRRLVSCDTAFCGCRRCRAGAWALSSPIGFAASRNPALREQWAAASDAAHRSEIAKRPTTRRMATAAIGSPSRASESRCPPTRSCSRPTTQPDAASAACATATGIRLYAVLSEPQRAEGKCTFATTDKVPKNAPCRAISGIPARASMARQARP